MEPESPPLAVPALPRSFCLIEWGTALPGVPGRGPHPCALQPQPSPAFSLLPSCQDLKKYGATTVVRVCEVTYDKAPLEKDGITVMVRAGGAGGCAAATGGGALGLQRAVRQACVAMFVPGSRVCLDTSRGGPGIGPCYLEGVTCSLRGLLPPLERVCLSQARLAQEVGPHAVLTGTAPAHTARPLRVPGLADTTASQLQCSLPVWLCCGETEAGLLGCLRPQADCRGPGTA